MPRVSKSNATPTYRQCSFASEIVSITAYIPLERNPLDFLDSRSEQRDHLKAIHEEIAYVDILERRYLYQVTNPHLTIQAKVFDDFAHELLLHGIEILPLGSNPKMKVPETEAG